MSVCESAGAKLRVRKPALWAVLLVLLALTFTIAYDSAPVTFATSDDASGSTDTAYVNYTGPFVVTDEITMIVGGAGNVDIPPIYIQNPTDNMGAYDDLELHIASAVIPAGLQASNSQTVTNATLQPAHTQTVQLIKNDQFETVVGDLNLADTQLFGTANFNMYFTTASVKGELNVYGYFQVGSTLEARLDSDCYPKWADVTYEWYAGNSAGDKTTLLQRSSSDTFTITDAQLGKYITVVAYDGSGVYHWDYTASPASYVYDENNNDLFDLYFGAPSGSRSAGFYANPQLTIGVQEATIDGKTVLRPKTTADSTTDLTNFASLQPILTKENKASYNYSIWFLGTYSFGSSATNGLNIYPVLRRWNTTAVNGTSVTGFTGTLLNYQSGANVTHSFKISGSASAHAARYAVLDTSVSSGYRVESVTVAGAMQTAADASNSSLVKINSGATVTFTRGKDAEGNVTPTILGDVYMSGTNGGCIYVEGGANLTLNHAVFGSDEAYGFTSYRLGNRGGNIANLNQYLTGSTGKGGAIYIAGADASVTCNGTSFLGPSTITNGEAPSAIFIDVISSGQTAPTLTLDNCTFKNNKINFPTSTTNVVSLSVLSGSCIMAASGTLSISNTTFDSSTGTGGASYGGAVVLRGYQTPVTSTFTNCVFTNNSGEKTGGAVFVYNNEARTMTTFEGCEFSSNRASGNGGAVEIYQGDVTFTRCGFINNSANGTSVGGAFDTFASTESRIVVNYSLFKDNSAQQGGAVYCNKQADVVGCIFDSNTARNSAGAWRQGAGSLTFRQCTFNANTSTSESGAVGLNGATSCTFTDITATKNVARYGGFSYISGTLTTVTGTSVFKGNSCTSNGEGGVFHTANSSSDFTIEGTATFEDNDGGLDGGALYLRSPTTVTGATFKGNYASRNGGAMQVPSNATNGPYTFTNCKFEDNTAPEVGAVISVLKAGATLNLSNCTVTGNGSSAGSTTACVQFSVAGTLNYSGSSINGNDCGGIAASETITITPDPADESSGWESLVYGNKNFQIDLNGTIYKNARKTGSATGGADDSETTGVAASVADTDTAGGSGS